MKNKKIAILFIFFFCISLFVSKGVNFKSKSYYFSINNLFKFDHHIDVKQEKLDLIYEYFHEGDGDFFAIQGIDGFSKNYNYEIFISNGYKNSIGYINNKNLIYSNKIKNNTEKGGIELIADVFFRDEKNIFWTSYRNSLVYKSDNKLNLSKKIFAKNFYNPIGISGNDNQIIVADYGNHEIVCLDYNGEEIWRKIWDQEAEKSFGVFDVIQTNDEGFMIFCQTDPAPYATLIKTDSEGHEEWRRKYDDYVGGGQGWIHQTEDGGYFMASGYAVTKLNPLGYVEWNAACSSCFQKEFNNGMVSGINHDMRPIQGGAVIVGYGSQGWE